MAMRQAQRFAEADRGPMLPLNLPDAASPFNSSVSWGAFGRYRNWLRRHNPPACPAISELRVSLGRLSAIGVARLKRATRGCLFAGRLLSGTAAQELS